MLGAVLLHDYLPNKRKLIHPLPNNQIQTYTDAEVGGNSSLEWLDRKQFSWRCHMVKSETFPYCGISLTWSASPYKRIDFSEYEKLDMTLEYQGDASKIRVYVRNYYPAEANSEKQELEVGKFNSTIVKTSDLHTSTEVKLSELAVADWWLDEFNIPRKDAAPELDEVISFGIDQANPVVFGDHDFKLKKVELVGQWITKETLYISIIALWGISFVVELLFRFYTMRSRERRHKIALDEMANQSAYYKQQAETDKLTGISNREGLAQTLAILEKQNESEHYAILLLDLDHFKQINDKHGHLIGDQILEELAKLISRNMRNDDLVARWGGEEFVVLFRFSDSYSVSFLAEKIRRIVATHQFIPDKAIPVTVSIGATQLQSGQSFEQSFKRADKALYRAKDKGRNQVVIA
ncbi:GGDEF domain-containing protein [Neptunicella sp.]|uniref:GGDEF domain-containing protein n=1 Tax=Neptunicella sp. TaxID=2125986 RepID=UPI003F68FC38